MRKSGSTFDITVVEQVMLQKATVKKLKPITMRYILFVLLYFFVALYAKGQTNTFPPSGSVGIGTTTPGRTLEVNGDISLPSSSGNKQIYTWSPTDANWRIGMSSTPGFSRSIATSHVQYLSYGNSAEQGFAVGVNGGQSSFEITSGNHQAFFRGNVGIGTTTPFVVVGN